MNEDSKKDTIMKILAVIGVIAALIIGVWLAVQVVSLIPGAFSSLASIFNSVHNGDNQTETSFTVVSNQSELASGEPITITWEEIPATGSYTFDYECIDGVSVELIDGDSRTVIDCETPLTIGGDTHSLDLVISSERRRFVDVGYTISFTPDTGKEMFADNFVTVVNSDIPLSGIATGTSTTTQNPVDLGTTNDEGRKVEDTTGNGATSGSASTPQPQVIHKSILVTPVSDPHGYVDLEVTYLSVGELTDDNKFIAGTSIDSDNRGAFRFAVKNIGTKTSQEWDFDADLTSGDTYHSEEQPPLLPNEQATMTIGFYPGDDDGFQSFGVEVDTDEDVNHRNNDFTWAVEVHDNGSTSHRNSSGAVILQ